MDHIGFRVPKERGVPESLSLADRAVDRGADALWVSEGLGRNRVVLLSLLADRYDDVAVGAGILNVYSRSPALLAMTAAGLADLTEEFILGLGSSNPAVAEGFHGVPFGNPLRRQREYIEIIDTLLAGESADYDGEYFDLSGLALRDVDTPYDVSVYLAANGETNLQLLGEFADGWLPLFVSPDGLRDGIDNIATGLDRRGRDADAVTVAPYVPTCLSADDPAAARDAVRSLLAFYVGAMGEFYRRNVSEGGFPAAADRIHTRWQDGDRAGAREAVTRDLLDAFTVAGSPESARDALSAFAAAGADSVVAYVPPRADERLLTDTIDHLY